MKILSFNIGIKIDNSLQVKNYLKEQNADIVCLQEVTRPLESSTYKMYRSEEEIRNFLKDIYPYYFFAPEWVANKLIESTGIKNRDFGGMVESGKLILSKYPIVHGYNYFYHKEYEFDCDRTNFYQGNDHGRALQVCNIDVNGTIIQVGNVHGFYSSDKQDTDRSLIQSNFIIEKLKQNKLPTVLVGDFNVLPETESIKIINNYLDNLNIKFNLSSTRADGKMTDYFFTSKEILSKSIKIDITDISDHYSINTEVELS